MLSVFFGLVNNKTISNLFVGAFALSLSLVQGVAFAASDQEGDINHSAHEHAMDHSMHEHTMDHSMHEQMLAKKNLYTSEVVSYSIPDIKLVDMNGDRIVLRELLDSSAPVALNFIFTTCTTICPVMTSTFQQVQAKLGSKHSSLRMVSISIDPENDTPARLKAYAAKFKAGAQWKFLTGSFENSVAVQQAFGAFAGEKMNHQPITFLKAQGSENQWIRLNGLLSASDIIKELDKLAGNEIHHH